MKLRNSFLVACGMLLGSFVVGLGWWAAIAAEPLEKIPAEASAKGKYDGLLKVLSVPEDKATYGEFYDYGEYHACDYADYKDLPAAHWVYVAPKWYLWKGLAKGDKLPAAASQNGKYDKLLAKLSIPEDEGFYGKEKDWGYYTGTSYKTFENLPPGYWVYVAPTWYIWEKQVKDSDGPQPPDPDAPEAPKKSLRFKLQEFRTPPKLEE